jgi:hypothetical protein
MRTTRLIPAAIAATAFCAPAARAADARPVDPDVQHTVQATFGNTVMSIYPDGRSQKIWLHADGTWDGKSRRNIALSGKWTMKGDKVCLRQSRPPTLPISFCQTMPKDPDVTLTSHDLTGQTIHLKIVKGITESGG